MPHKKNDTAALKKNTQKASEWFQLAVLHQKKGELDEAIGLYQKILTLFPNHSDTLQMVGIVLCAKKEHEKALEFFDRAIAIHPNHIRALSNRGNALVELKRYEESLESYNRALALSPEFVDGLSNRGAAFQKLKRLEEALADCDYALSLDPNCVSALSNRGNTLKDMRRFEEALACYDKALAINPYHSDTWYNRGNNLQEMGLYREALASYEKTLTMTPENQKAHFNDGACRLLLGDFKEGWKQYEWRWKAPDNIAQLQKHIKPRWVGESLLGKRIYLDVEQGLGDMIQFVRFVKTIADLGAYVLLPCVDSLADLFRNVEGVGKIILNGQAYPELDYHCPLMSVPFVLGIELATLPNKVPYLYSDEKKCEEWLNRLGKKTKLRVGLVWSGNPEFGNDHNRSIPLEKLSYLNSDKIEWHSLHKECRESDESILKQRGDIHFWGEHIESFSDTAALIDLMDLVISVDTAVAHLAGAMNKPVWILLPFSPDWRWLIGRDDSPWYQSAKLFRQTEYGNWDEVIQRVDAALKLDWVK